MHRSENCRNKRISASNVGGTLEGAVARSNTRVQPSNAANNLRRT
jgi:hypothetical protein